MKKYIGILFLSLIVVMFIKYFNAEYKIKYNLDDHSIIAKYENGRYYVEIDGKYNFDIYKSRGLKKLKIKQIKVIDDNELYCIIPIIDGINTYPLCYLNKEYIDYNLVDNEEINEYKNTYTDHLKGNFSFNNNLNKKEYILLWNYKGFYRMNGEDINTINLFKEGKYDNNLMCQINNELLFPDYKEEYNFKVFYLLDIGNGNKKTIESKYEFSYDGYIVGNINNKIYFYDNKNSKLYEINIKKSEIKLIGSEELGYIKYINKKQVVAKKSEYKNQEINYINEKSNYKYSVENYNLYKVINDNENIKIKIFNGEKIKVIKENNNDLYFISNDIMYKYNPSIGYIKIFNYFELNFNTNNIIYIYNK